MTILLLGPQSNILFSASLFIDLPIQLNLLIILSSFVKFQLLPRH